MAKIFRCAQLLTATYSALMVARKFQVKSDIVTFKRELNNVSLPDTEKSPAAFV